MGIEADSEMVYCRECGSKILSKAEICPECGVRQKGSKLADTGKLTDHYSIFQWIAAVIVSVITFPFGLAVPAYFYLKASKGKGVKQSGWEAWAVILAGIIGILVVELGGETGAKILLAIVIGAPLLIVLAAVLASFVLGLGEPTSAQIMLPTSRPVNIL